MDIGRIPAVRDDVHILRVKTPERQRVVLCLASKGKEIIPSEDTCHLIALCDGTHTVEEIVSHFVQISGEHPSSVETQLEKIFERLVEVEVIQFYDVPTPRQIPPEVELVHSLEHIVMEITNACNLNCIHCYNDSGHKIRDELTLTEFYKVINEMKNLGVLRITLSGGEPLLHPQFFEIAQYIRDKGLELGLFTNGTLITRNVAKTLRDLSFLKVTVSVDSLTPDVHDYFRGRKGAWKKTMEGINHLKAEGMPIKPAVALSKFNKAEIVDLLTFFLEQKFNDYQLMPVFATGRKVPLDFDISPEEYEKVVKDVFILEKKYKTKPHSLTGKKKTVNCGVGTYSLVIKSNGDVVPCPAFGRRVLVGNVKDQSLKSIWNDSPLLNQLRNLDCHNHPVCKTCDVLEYCRGGCIANVCLRTGNLEVCDPYTCAYVRASTYAAECTEKMTE